MKKKSICISILLLLLLILSVTGLKFYQSRSEGLDGTYSAGNEPDDNNIYLTLKDGNFTVYDQNQILASGSVKETDSDHTGDVYELISKDNTRAGYIVHNKKQMVLLGFQDIDYSLERISKEAIYLDYESESASLPETLTLYYYKDNKPVQKDLTDSALIETFTRLYDASGLKESEQQYRGIPSFFLDFHNGYVVGVYEDLPYCYIGDSLKKEENHLWVEGKTAMKVGYTLSEEAWKLLLDQVK